MKQRNMKGFTLIEVMVVVAIIGILTAVAYPSYLNQILKTKRATANTSILECASILERRFTLGNSYGADADAATAACANVDNDDYALTVTVGNVQNGRSNEFDITATPGASLDRDLDCRTLTYSHLGVKGSTGTGGNVVCWRST